MPEGANRYVLDTVSLSNFALCDGLWLLRERYGTRLAITDQVLNEIEAGVVSGRRHLVPIVTMVDDGELTLVAMGPDERQVYRSLLPTLGTGEASCLAVASSGGTVVATDDAHARSQARDLGVPVTGTVGILKAACIDGDLSLEQAEDMLEAMIGAGYYSPVRRLADIMP